MLFFEVKAFFGEKAIFAEKVIIGKRLYRRMSSVALIFSGKGTKYGIFI